MAEPNKVIYNGNMLIDLTKDTVSSELLAFGITAHDASGSAIVGTAYKNTYYVKGTQTAATGTWTGVLPEVDALYDGLTIDYWLPFAGSGNATLNLTLKDGTKTGAKNCYRDGTNRLTTQVGANSICRLVYQTVTISGTSYTGWWLTRTLDNNTTDIVNLYEGSAAFAAKSAVYRYQLLFQTDANTLTPLNNADNNTGTGKTMLTGVDFMPFGKIYYYNSTTNIATNGNMTTALYYHRNGVDLRYTFNCGQTLTAHRDFYLKCAKQSNGMFRIVSGTCWTQTLPTSNDGYYYLLLGRTYSTYQFELYTEHPIYYHDGTEIVRYTKLTFDSAPTANSTNPVTSGGVKTALDGKQNTLTFDTTPTANSTNPVTSGGVKTALDNKYFLSASNSNKIKTIADDTPPNWRELKNRVFFYDTNDELIDKPSNYGILINTSIGSEVSQIWFTQPSGKIYRRSGSFNDWATSWVELAKDVLYYQNQAVSVATSAQIMRIPASGTSTLITTDTVVLECTFADPANIVSDVTWTSYAGYITFTGRCTAATTANVVLGSKSN